MYLKNGRAKLEIALGRGKKLHDKRADLAVEKGLAHPRVRFAGAAGPEKSAFDRREILGIQA